MHVLFVLPECLPSVWDESRWLANLGVRCTVLTTDAVGPEGARARDAVREAEAEPRHVTRVCRRVGRGTFSPALIRLLPGCVREADVVHVVTVYAPAIFPVLLAARTFRTPLLWSPAGGLQRWEGSTRRAAKAVWERACRAVAPPDLAFRAASAEEAASCARRFPRVPSVVVPHGVDVPRRVVRVPSPGVFRLLTLGRLHPIKGLDRALGACRILRDASSLRWRLTVAGGGAPSTVRHLKRVARGFRLEDRVTFLGPVRPRERSALFARHDVLLVPSHIESFCLVVAEALAHGVPVIVSRGAPWRDVEREACGLWVKNEPETLADAILRMARLPRDEMGRRGRAWMAREFSPDRVARRLRDVYDDLLSRARRRRA